MRGLALAIAVATWLASGPAWGHAFPAVRTVVIQVEGCEVAVLVGFRPATGEATDAILSRVASQPKSQGRDALESILTNAALAPLAFSVDGKRLVPTAVHAKVGVEPTGVRPMVVVLVTYALPAGKQLEIATADPRTTRFSWVDRASHRIELQDAPSQGRWYDGVASFLLSMSPKGDSTCAAPSSSPPSRSRH